MAELRLEILDALDAGAEPIWRRLENAARPSYFLTWGWIENWLACLPREARPDLVVVHSGEKPVAAFFLGRKRIFRHGFVSSRGLFLNATGVPRWDEICAEHNGILCATDATLSLPELIDLLPRNWDELVLPALARETFPGSHLERGLPGHRIVVEREVIAPFVDLERVRATPGGYLALLAANTRAQIRRAMRSFDDLRLEVASDLPKALEMYEELVQLHTLRWRERGQPGAFADPWFDAFHRRLIQARFAKGEIQLLRIRSRAETVGVLYDLVANGRVLFYQSGMSASADDPRRKPGYVCHAEAVRLNAQAGFASYEFLGGEGRYKQSLSTDESHLVWARIQRPLARFSLERRLGSLKRAWVAARTQPRP